MADFGALLGRKRPEGQVRVRIMLESGRLVDEVADVIQTQVIADKARASFRSRPEVALYLQMAENTSPVWRENLLVETGTATPPGTDSRYVLQDSLNLFKALRSRVVEPLGGLRLENKHVQIAVVVAAIFVFLVCGWLASINLEAGQNPVQAQGPGSIGGVGEHQLGDEPNATGLVDPDGTGLITPDPADAPAGPAGTQGLPAQQVEPAAERADAPGDDPA